MHEQGSLMSMAQQLTYRLPQTTNHIILSQLSGPSRCSLCVAATHFLQLDVMWQRLSFPWLREKPTSCDRLQFGSAHIFGRSDFWHLNPFSKSLRCNALSQRSPQRYSRHSWSPRQQPALYYAWVGRHTMTCQASVKRVLLLFL